MENLQNLNSLKYFCKMYFCSVFILFLIFGSVCPSSSPSSAHFLEAKLASKRRILRSPLLPPTVTSFQLPNRSAKTQIDKNLKVASSEHALMPPIIQSRNPSSSIHRLEESPVPQISRKKNFKTYSLPSHPMMVFQETSLSRSEAPVDKKENESEKATAASLQEGEHTFKGSKNGDKENRGRTFEDDSRLSNRMSNGREDTFYESEIQHKLTTICHFSRGFSNCPPLIFADYQEVLAAINKTNEQLQIVLQNKRISINDFLDFIERGAKKEDILEFLSRPNNQRGNNIKPHMYNSYNPEINNNFENDEKSFSQFKDNSSKENVSERQRTLTDLPFTEIVHEIPASRRKSPEVTSQIMNEDTKRIRDNYDKKSEMSKNTQMKKSKNYKNFDEEEEIKKFSKNRKRNKNNPDLDEQFYLDYNSTLFLPPKDSPIITAFLPPSKEIEIKDKKSATIISMSIKEDKNDFISKVNPNHEGSRMITKHDIRNKVVNDREAETKSSFPNKLYSHSNQRIPIYANTKGGIYETADEGSNFSAKGGSYTGTKREKKDFSVVEQSSKLKLVLPMKGILLLCGILVVVAFVTIVLLIMYGALKHNRKPRMTSAQISSPLELESSS